MPAVSGWDQTRKKSEEHESSGGLFLKLSDDGDKAIGAFCGEPLAREVHWINKTQSYEDCEGDGCDECDKSNKTPSLRISMNFYDTEAKSMKIWEFSNAVFTDVCKVKDKYGLDKQYFEIERHGKKGDTDTSYSILPEGEIDSKLKKEIAKAKLHDLTKSGKDADEGGQDFPDDEGAEKKAKGDENGEDKTVPKKAVTAITNRLKGLPKKDIKLFMEEFKVEKIRELTESQVKAAVAFIKEKEAARDAGDDDENEEDPFA